MITFYGPFFMLKFGEDANCRTISKIAGILLPMEFIGKIALFPINTKDIGINRKCLFLNDEEFIEPAEPIDQDEEKYLLDKAHGHIIDRIRWHFEGTELCWVKFLVKGHHG